MFMLTSHVKIARIMIKHERKMMETQRKRLNCWEFKKCGREPGGAKAEQFGVCPATTDEKLNAVHGGKNAGRSCWVVAGTMCGGRVQGTFAQKYQNCDLCDFFRAVKEEEGPAYQLLIVLLNKIKAFEKYVQGTFIP
jgi:hypothetical protein